MKLGDKYEVSASTMVEVTVHVTVEVDNLPKECYDYDPETGIIVLTAEGRDHLMDEAQESMNFHGMVDWSVVDCDIPWGDGDFTIYDEDGEVDPTDVDLSEDDSDNEPF